MELGLDYARPESSTGSFVAALLRMTGFRRAQVPVILSAAKDPVLDEPHPA
jgi:hypothetical protein